MRPSSVRNIAGGRAGARVGHLRPGRLTGCDFFGSAAGGFGAGAGELGAALGGFGAAAGGCGVIIILPEPGWAGEIPEKLGPGIATARGCRGDGAAEPPGPGAGLPAGGRA